MQPVNTASESIKTVTTLVQDVKALIGEAFSSVWVAGEISNFKRPASGHCYFTLKDDRSQIKCVMWSSVAKRLFFQPDDGIQVRILGSVGVYEARGDLQLIVQALEPQGEGALRIAFEKLKAKLAAEGLFDASHKRSLPPYPEVIGVITSGTGAALHDICSILERRFPQVRVLVCPVQVQGAGAAESIAEAIQTFDALPEDDPFRPDLPILGRGGGSVEDLWAFNEEIVARAIFEASIPIVSGVGHETDFSISDFVADVRAATPSMAAELAVPDRNEVAATIRGYHAFLRDRALRSIADQSRHVRQIIGSRAFNRPVDYLHQCAQQTDDLVDRLHRCPDIFLRNREHRLESLTSQLHLLHPRLPLERGYVLAERNHEPIHDAAGVSTGDELTLHFRDGSREVTVDA